ncbi:MAG: GNAT family protein [Cytophagales bacterium]
MNGEKIFLRPLQETDIPQTLEWMNDEEISDIMGYLPVKTLAEQLNWFKTLISSQSKFVFAICENNTKEHIGNVGLGNIDYIHRHAMFNIFIKNVENRSKGIGTDATSLILKFAFNRLNLNKVYLRTSERFVEANKMYLKLGFQKEGVMRQHYFTNGKYEDKIIYSILKEEFQ